MEKNMIDIMMPDIAPIMIEVVIVPSLKIKAKLPRKVIENVALLNS